MTNLGIIRVLKENNRILQNADWNLGSLAGITRDEITSRIELNERLIRKLQKEDKEK
jgi:hypothetical protein